MSTRDPFDRTNPAIPVGHVGCSRTANLRRSSAPARNLISPSARPGGGRTWWAHFEFTRINIEPIILRKKIEEQLVSGAIGLGPPSLCLWEYHFGDSDDVSATRSSIRSAISAKSLAGTSTCPNLKAAPQWDLFLMKESCSTSGLIGVSLDGAK